jgi:predicted acyl esterase
MISDEIFRGRFRKSFERPEAITPNEVTPYAIDLHTANHVFRKGHRIMVQVQSTWFPLYDRNPQKFVANIFEAKESDFQKARQRIYRSKRFPSSVEISVLPQAASQTAAK